MQDYLSQEDRFVIVNYLRKADLGQEKGGHISPLAAYDTETDRFLILDVSRYKYPPVWFTAPELFAAMNTTDADNQNRTRGFFWFRRQRLQRPLQRTDLRVMRDSKRVAA